MIAEVAIVCTTVLAIAGMVLYDREKTRPVPVVRDDSAVEALKEEVKKLESRVNQLNVGKLRL